MKNKWIWGLMLAAGITLETVAQTPNTGVSGSSSPTTSGQKTPAAGSGQKAQNDNPTGRRGGATNYPAAGYSSGSNQRGSGKMSSGQSRAGNSNLQTGSTKTGELTNDPNVNTAQQPGAPGGSGSGRPSAVEATTNTNRPTTGRATRPARKAHTYTHGSTSNTSQGAASSGAVTNVDQVKTNMSRPSGKTGKEYSGTSNNGSTKRRRASGTGAPATSASTLDQQGGGSGRNNRQSTSGGGTSGAFSGTTTTGQTTQGQSRTGSAQADGRTNKQGNYNAGKGSTTGPSAGGTNTSRYNGSGTKPKPGQTPNN